MLDLIHIKKDYYVDKKPFAALKDLSISFKEVGFVAILGPSGCGKTTTLNIIGGLDHYTSGDLLINGKSTKDFKDSNWDAYRNEQVGFVFQSYNLIPHQNVLSNVETALLLNGVSRKERKERALKALEKVGLSGSEKKKPNQLSGGQMQRVAIARAIVNNPKIILADEPTGALDSVTSIQIMEILKEMSKTCLVIMVTHNAELAKQYAERIIEMKDGEIVKDSAPLPIKTKSDGEYLEKKKTSMSLLTTFKSSFMNICTKKARTMLTSIASSIGIIGVALVLSITNGFTQYVGNLETSVASSVPITINKVTYSYSSNDRNESYTEYPSDQKVFVYDSSSTKSIAHTNYYTKEYVNEVLDPLVKDGLAQSVLLNRQGLSFNLIKEVKSSIGEVTYKQINQYKSASASGSLLDVAISLPTTIFHELYGQEEGLGKMYDTICGRFPKSSDELVLITDRYNRVKKNTLVNLGLLASDDKETASISFSDILDSEYKAYFPSKLYQESQDPAYTLNVPAYENITPAYDLITGKVTYSGTKTTKVIHRYKDIDDSQKGLKQVYENDALYQPKVLKIVGVLRPSESSYINLMPSSIGYLASLKDEFVNDVETNCRDLQNECKNAWYFSTKQNSSKNDLDGLGQLGEAMTNAVKALLNGDGTINSSLASEIASSINYEYFSTKQSLIDDGKRMVPYYSGYFSSAKLIGADFREDLVGKFIDALSSSSGNKRDELLGKLVLRIQEPSFYSNEYENSSFDIRDDSINMDFNILDLAAYFQSYSLITSVLIFPSSLANKEALKARLDAWNSSVPEAQNVYYTDIMSSYTSSLGTLISLISLVLVIFASISLVVSSIMTSIITYISVVERTKEIGIIRACGARKRDVGHLFEAECVMIGTVAGLIGVGVTALLNIPLSIIIDHMYPGNGLEHIASLNPLHALILLLLSILLAFLSGLIPARMGARKDPVEALRSE